MTTELMHFAQQWLAFSLVLSAQLLLILMLRKPVRARLGAVACYRLWLLPVAWLPLYFLGPFLLASLATPAPVGGAPGSATPYQQALQQFVDIELLPFTFDIGSTTPAASGDTKIHGWSVLAVLWTAGTVALMIWHTRRWLTFSREVRASGLPLSATEKAYTGTTAHFDEELPVLRLNAMNSAAIFGVFKPALLLPGTFTQRYDENQRHIILAHEAVHLRRGDNGWNLCAMLLIALFWTNPLVFIAWRNFRLDQELSCDALALARCNKEQQKRYARTLLDSLRSLSSAHTNQPALSAWDNLGDIKERSLMVNQHMHIAKRPLATLVSTIALAVLGASLTIAFADLVSPVVQAAEPARPAQTVQREVQEAQREVQLVQRQIQQVQQEVQMSLQQVEETQQRTQVTQQQVQQVQQQTQVVEQQVQGVQRDVRVAQGEVQATQRAVQEGQRDLQATQQQTQEVQQEQRAVQEAQQEVQKARQEEQAAPAQNPSGALRESQAPADEVSAPQVQAVLAGAATREERALRPSQDIGAQTARALTEALEFLNGSQLAEMAKSFPAPEVPQTQPDPVPQARITPDYPRRALALGLEGWVKVRFTVSETGSVVDAVVVDSRPKRIFDNAAIQAVSRWRYSPPTQNAVAVQYAGVETMFRFTLADI